VSPEPKSPAGFDKYAAEYDASLAQGLSVSGESKDYFAEGRVSWLGQALGELKFRPTSVLDFGCGTGTNSPFLLGLDGVVMLHGVDVSKSSLDVARHTVPDIRAHFTLLDQYLPQGNCDLAFTNGVFHHIPVKERAGAIDYLYRALRPGGLLAFWENNPWNPGTRYVMSRIPFDRDAIMLSSIQAGKMARAAGFEVLRTDFLFVFPNLLHPLRILEPWLVKLPIGAQYQVLCRKSAAP
jgi:SAM-dependent methyltransferase